MADETAMQMNLRTSASRVIRDYSRMHGLEERIDGLTPEEAANMVDLTIGYTPVLLEPHFEGHGPYIPEPTRVQTDGKVYAAVWPGPCPDFLNLDDKTHRVARARFLLLRGWYYKTFDRYSHREKQMIIAWYFGGSMWRPAPGSDLSKAMGLELGLVTRTAPQQS